MPFVFDPKSGQYQYKSRLSTAEVEQTPPAELAAPLAPGASFIRELPEPAPREPGYLDAAGSGFETLDDAMAALGGGLDKYVRPALMKSFGQAKEDYQSSYLKPAVEAVQPYLDPLNDQIGRDINLALHSENIYDPAANAKVDTARAQPFSAQAAAGLRGIPSVLGMEGGAGLALPEEVEQTGAEIEAPTTYTGHGVQQVADFGFSLPTDPGMLAYGLAGRVLKKAGESLEVAQKLAAIGVPGADKKLQASLKALRMAEMVDVGTGAASLPGMVESGLTQGAGAVETIQNEGWNEKAFGQTLGALAPGLMSAAVVGDMRRATGQGFTAVPSLEGINQAAEGWRRGAAAEGDLAPQVGVAVPELTLQEPPALEGLGTPETLGREALGLEPLAPPAAPPAPGLRLLPPEAGPEQTLYEPFVEDRDFVDDPAQMEDAAAQEEAAAQAAALDADLAELDARIAARAGEAPPQGPRMVISPEEAVREIPPSGLILPPGMERPAPAPEPPPPFRGRVALEDDFGRAIEEAASQPPRAPRLVPQPEVRMSPDARAAQYAEAPPLEAPLEAGLPTEAPVAPSSEAAAPPPPARQTDEDAGTHKFSTTQVDLPPQEASRVRDLAESIPDSDLAEDGRETKPHVTVKYGLHTSDVAEVQRVLAGEPPIRVTLGETSLFDSAETGENHDVVKVDVDSADLQRLNAKIAAALEVTDTHPDYKPHVTVAYVKKGRGKKYVGKSPVTGREMTISTLTFSTKEGQTFEVALTGEAPAAAATAPTTPPVSTTPAAPAPVATTPAVPSTEGAQPLTLLMRATRALGAPVNTPLSGAALWNAYSQQAREVGKTASLSAFRKAVSESGLPVEPDGTYITKEVTSGKQSAVQSEPGSPESVSGRAGDALLRDRPARPEGVPADADAAAALDSFRSAIDGLVAEDVYSGASAPEAEVRKLLSNVLPGDKFDAALAAGLASGDMQRIGSTVGFTPQGIAKLKAQESAFDEALERTAVGSFTTKAKARVKTTGEKALKRMKKRREGRGSTAFDISTVLAEGGKDAADITIWAASQLLQKGMDFPHWSKAMVKEFGKKITPHLEKLFGKAHEYLKWQQELYRPIRKKAGDRVNHALRGVVARYAAKYDLDIDPRTHTYARFDAVRARKIADAYEAMQHNPNDPRVRASYEALLEETGQQWDFLQSEGYKLEPWTKEGQPYDSSAAMRNDVRANKHLWFFTGGDMPVDHPLAAQSGRTAGGQQLTYNDVFRAIHDTFAHAKEGFEFGQLGEEAAWNEHYMMFTPAARPAMTTETRGQNSWVNFGRHLRTDWGKVPQKGEAGFVEPEKRPYAEQKAGILPEEFVSQQVPRRKMVGPEKLRVIIVQASNGKRVTVQDVGEALQTYSRKRWGILTGTAQEKAFQRALTIGREEISYQLEQKQTGVQWYAKDVADMEEGVKQIHPDLADPNRMTLFKTLVAATSFGNRPDQNLDFALQIWDQFNKSGGKFPLKQASGKHWAGRPPFGFGVEGGASSASKLQSLVDDLGVDGAANFLRADHTVKDLRKYSPSISGKADDVQRGFNILGPKGGPFAGNLHGIHENLTADLWFSRTWHRWMGTLLDPSTPTGLKQAPSSEGERAQMGRAIERLAEEFGLTTADTQAVLWYHEKQLYNALGAAGEVGSYAAAAKRELAKRGEPAQLGLFDEPAGLGEGDATASEQAGGGREDAEPGRGAVEEPERSSEAPDRDRGERRSTKRPSTGVGDAALRGDYVEIPGEGALLFVQTENGYPHDWVASLAVSSATSKMGTLASRVFNTINRFAQSDSVFQGFFATPGFNGVHTHDRNGKNIYLNLLQMADTARDELASWIPLTGRPGILAENIVHTLIHEVIHNKLPHDYSNGDRVFLDAQAKLFDELVERGVVDQLVDTTHAELTANNNRLYSWLTQKAAEGKVLNAQTRNRRSTDRGEGATVRDAGLRRREADAGGPPGAPIEAAPGPARGAGPEGAVREGEPGAPEGVESAASARGIAESITGFKERRRAVAAATVATPPPAAGPSSPIARPIPPSKEFVFHPRGKITSQGPPRLTEKETKQAGAAFRDTATAPTVGKPSSKRGEPETDVNVSRISTDAEVRDAVARLVESQPDTFGRGEAGARGEPRDWDYVRRQAIKLGIDPNTVLKNWKRKGGMLSDIEMEQATIVSEEISRRMKERVDKMKALQAAGKQVESDVEQILFEADTSSLAAVRFTIIGARSEAARVLSLARKLGSGLTNEERAYRSFVNLHKTLGPAFQKEFYDAITRGDWKKVNQLQAKAFNPTLMQKILEMWKAGILSGPKSHPVNFISTGAHVAGVQPLEAFSAGALDAIRAKLSGIPDAQRERFMGEGLAMLRGAHAALGAALHDPDIGLLRALRDIKDGSFEMRESQRTVENQQELYGKQAIQGRLGERIRTPFQMLTAADNFWKVIAEAQYIHREAFRDGRRRNLSAHALEGHVKGFVDSYANLSHPQQDALHLGAKQAAKVGTFQEDMPRVIRNFAEAETDWPIIGFVVPFKKTPWNIGLAALTRTPLGFIPAYRAHRKGDTAGALDAGAKAALGTAMMAALYLLADEMEEEDQFGITGGGPADFRMLQNLRDTGWQPYSVWKKGSDGKKRYLSYQRLDPISSLMGMIADSRETRKEEGSKKVLTKAVMTIQENITNKTFLAGLMGASRALNDPQRHFSEWFQQFEASALPFSGFLGSIAMGIDPHVRKTDTALPTKELPYIPPALAARIPFVSLLLPPKKTVVGEDVQRVGGEGVLGGLQRALNPFPISTERSGALADVQREFSRMGYVPSLPSRQLKLAGGRSLELSAAEYEKYLLAYNDAGQRLSKMIRSSYWKNLPDTDDIAPPGSPSKESETRKLYSEAKKRSRATLYQDQSFRRRAARAQKGLE